jgi:cell division ATPase FtsA
MSPTVTPFIGIDFGTSKSVIARYDTGTGHAKVIYNQEGRPETPSVVYLGRSDSDIVIGGPAEMILDAVQVDQSRFAISIKRDLLSDAPKILDGNRIYRPVDIAAKILGKLKDDAERLSFQREPVKRAVITCPASFDQLQQDKIKHAATIAGLEDVRLLPEPVAAAIACSRSSLRVGKYVLVYDFGGGTFDVAVLESNPHATNSSFELASPPRGLSNCGGDDLDRKLYDYCEEIALRELHRRISLTNDIDLKFLHECRKRKENLSSSDTATFSNYLISSSGADIFEHTLQRATFEERIREYIDRTVVMTQDVIRDANSRQCRVDTVILIGGSSRVPMVMRSLMTSLPVQPQEWHERDFAVALGAAYHAQDIWGPKVYNTPSSSSPTDAPSQPSHSEQYRSALLDRWAATRRLTRVQVGELTDLASRLGMSTEDVAHIEQQIMSDTKENILILHESALEQYRRTVAEVWNEGGLVPPEVAYLTGQARMLNLSKEDAAGIERYVMGDTKKMVLRRTPPPSEQYRHALSDRWTATQRLTQAQVEELANLANRLGISIENVATIERQIMGDTKENILMRYQAALEQYRRTVAGVWKGKGLAPSAVNDLTEQVRMLNLSREEAESIERSVMGDTKDRLLRRSKTLPIIGLIIGLFFLIAGGGHGGSLVVGLAILIPSIVWLVRKQKAKQQVPPPVIRK